MKVFISWSGKISHKVAIALRDWLPCVIQAVEPFVSSEDLERGTRWFADIGTELEKVNFGILCITPQNLSAPWVLFEAGALSKSMDQSRVSPLLIGVKNSDLEGPLSQFNTTSIGKPEVFKLVKTINKQLGELSLPDQKVEKAFEKWWPELACLLDEALKEAGKSGDGKHKPTRTQSELLEEILELTRGISRQVAKNTEDELRYKTLKQLVISSGQKEDNMGLSGWRSLEKWINQKDNDPEPSDKMKKFFAEEKWSSKGKKKKKMIQID